MKTPIFDFKKHQNYRKSWKMLVRFIIYGGVILFLLYLIFYNEKTSPDKSDDATINQFDVEIIEPQSE
jgi:RsiW-degrading membrane proteinase PrsW (M82 family)